MKPLAPPPISVPSTLWVPERKGSYGPEIIDFATEIGIPTDDTQRRDIDCLASYGLGGQWLTLETCIIEGRQNGKTKGVVLPIALADLFLYCWEPDRIIWTSHLMKTSRDTFNRVQQLIEGSAFLSSKVKEIIEAKAEEAIILNDGSSLEFLARTTGGGRGLGCKRLIFDEALFLRADAMGATIPTLSARGNPQISYASSAGKTESDHLRTLQRRGRRGGDPSLILIEYRAPGGWNAPGCRAGLGCSHIVDDSTGCALDNEENYVHANHAITHGRMRLEFVRAERRALGQTAEGVREFGRERLGWEELGGTPLDSDRIPEARWAETCDPDSTPDGLVAFAIDMPPDASAVSIGMAGTRADGSIHFGVVDYRRGNGWLVERLSELIAKHETACGVLWQPSAPIGALGTRLEAAGIELVAVSGTEMGQACGAMKDHIVNGTAFHRPHTVLDGAYASAERRVNAEGSWTFGRRKSAGDISPMVAVTEAVYGIDTHMHSSPGVYVV